MWQSGLAEPRIKKTNATILIAHKRNSGFDLTAIQAVSDRHMLPVALDDFVQLTHGTEAYVMFNHHVVVDFGRVVLAGKY